MSSLKKILLVEDDIFLVRVYQNMMPKEEYAVDYVTDGVEVAAKVAQTHYDLILLDLAMPQKDGFAVLKELQANAKTKSIPVFVLSKISSKDGIDRVLKLGAEKYILKMENSFAEVIAMITERLK